MFGLTFEKLLLIGVIAAFLIGPERLPHYASVFARLVRSIKEMATGAKERIKEEMGDDFDEDEWRQLDPRQYDPRRIIRDALIDAPEPERKVAAGTLSATTEASQATQSKKPASKAPRDTNAATPFDIEST